MQIFAALLIGASYFSVAISDSQTAHDPFTGNTDWGPVRHSIEQLEEWKQTNIQCVLEFVTSLHSLNTDQPLRYVLGIDLNPSRRGVSRRRTLEIKNDPVKLTTFKSKRKLMRKLELPSREASSRRKSRFDNVKLENRQISEEMMAQMLAQMNNMPQGPQTPSYDMSQYQGMMQPGMGQPGMGQPGQPGHPGIGHMPPQGISQPSQPGMIQPVQPVSQLNQPGLTTETKPVTPGTKTVEITKKTTKEKVTGAIHAIHEWREQLITLAMNYASALRNLKLEQFIQLQELPESSKTF